MVSVQRALTALACAGGLAAAPVQAQQQLAMGQTVTGVLTVSSPQWQDGARYTAYTFMGQAGQSVTITMSSTEFDTYLILMDPAGNELARDDDGGGGTNSRLAAQLGFTGQYRVIAKGFRADLYGNFTIGMVGTGGVAMNQPQPIGQPMPMVGSPNQLAVIGNIGANQQVMGNLSAGEQRWDGKPIQIWAFACTAGQPVQMDVLSSWDNYAVIFDPMGNRVAQDDDGGPESLNARINHTCAMTGVHRLGITTFSTSTTPGAYTLQVQAGQAMALNQPTPINQPAPVPMNQPQPIAPQGSTMPTPVPMSMAITGAIPNPGETGQIEAGQNVQGRLETGDQQMNDGTWADVWQFRGAAGQRIRIELRSEEFDTYVQLLDSRGNRLAEDDDSLGDLDSMVEFTLPAAGMYQIVVNNFSEERRAGVYTLSLR